MVHRISRGFWIACSLLVILLSGCRSREPRDVTQMIHAFEEGMGQALQFPDSQGERCGAASSRTLSAVSCRVGFSSFRDGQVLAETMQPLSYCRLVPARINEGLMAFQLEELSNEERRYVLQACRLGYSHPRPQPTDRRIVGILPPTQP